MNIIRWDPFRETVSLRNAMDRLFEDSYIHPSRFWPELRPGELPLDLDVYQTADDVVVKASLPGIKPEEVDISLTGDILTIKGEHKEEKEVKEQNYIHKERRHGTFSRSIQVPASVKSDKAEAVFENGVLTLTLPKAEEEKPRQIKVKAKSMIEGTKK